MKGVIAVTTIALCTNIVLAKNCDDVPCHLDAIPSCTVDVSGNMHTYIGSCSFHRALCRHPEKKIRILHLGICPGDENLIEFKKKSSFDY
ncbi:hypothetical protein QE152_g11237 [Popillia japonica]|uniref:Kazal-like domain-containing protein n=1 Tax=Popillia japonica TaxID=7064 RepID=A0AAW1LQM5_POPJA